MENALGSTNISRTIVTIQIPSQPPFTGFSISPAARSTTMLYSAQKQLLTCRENDHSRQHHVMGCKEGDAWWVVS